MTKNNDGIKVTRTWVAIEKLSSGLAYQRGIKEWFVREAVDKFDELAVEPVCVSLRDGKYNVVDGQHTIAILKAMGRTRVFCEIREGLDFAGESAWFVQKETKGRKQTINSLLNARAYSGDDKNLNALIDCLSVVGYSLKLVGVKNTYSIINASDTVEKIFNELGCVMFLDFIKLHKKVFDGDKKSLQSNFLNGFCLFFKTYRKDINEKRLEHVFNCNVNKNVKQTSDIILEAKRDVDSKDTSLKYAKVFVRSYNHNIRKLTPLKISKLDDLN